jgi:hypothetical protein
MLAKTELDLTDGTIRLEICELQPFTKEVSHVE